MQEDDKSSSDWFFYNFLIFIDDMDGIGDHRGSCWYQRPDSNRHGVATGGF